MSLRDVTFGYGATTVVEAVTAQLAAGRLTVLLGPNAAGKSTLLRLMLGQLSPRRGVCEVDGHDVATLDATRRAAVLSYVPQHSTAVFAFTVRQVVAMGRHALPRDPAAIHEALAACDLLDLQHRIYRELSAGQQQRVLLARAVAQAVGQGRIMLLDEPVSSMDLRHVEATMRLLKELAGRGLAVLAVLHDLNLAARWADELWLMHRGRLVATGTVEQVLQPSVLEPVYGVPLRNVAQAGQRPVLVAE